jgi:hypothetical protein
MHVDIPITLRVSLNHKLTIDELVQYVSRVETAIQESIWMADQSPIAQVLAHNTIVVPSHYTPTVTLRKSPL